MKCKTVRKNISRYHEKSLSAGQGEMIGKHLDGCTGCAGLYNDFVSTLELLDRRKRMTDNPYLFTRIRQKLEESTQNQKAPTSNYRRIWQPALLTLLLLFGIFMGIKLGFTYELNGQEQQISESTTAYYLNDLEQENIEQTLLNDQQDENQ